MSNAAGKKRKLVEVEDSDGSDDGVQFVKSPPAHMRKISNRDNPVVLHDSSDEEGDASNSKAQPPFRKRVKVEPSAIAESAKTARREANQPIAGPSRQPPASLPSAQRAAAGPSTQPAVAGPTTPQPTAGPSTQLPTKPSSNDILAEVISVLPDICPDWAAALLPQAMTAADTTPAAYILAMAMEVQGGYVKAKPKPALNREPSGKEKEKNYMDSKYNVDKRLGARYLTKTALALQTAFKYIPTGFIRTALRDAAYLYAPAHFALRDASRRVPLPYAPLKRARPAARDVDDALAVMDAAIPPIPGVNAQGLTTTHSDHGYSEWLLEKAWLDAFLEKERMEASEAEAKRLATEETLANGGGMECGCCFGEEPLNEMYQCAEGHLFCGECSKTHAETQLGMQSTSIACMDTGGCTAFFPDSELERLLPDKSLSLYHRLRQAKELELAAIEGLETCPACHYAEIMDNKEEKLFVCKNTECSQVSCRKCRQKEHIPKSCEEMEAIRKLNSKHTVEDAMSEALIRKCPKCDKAYMKETGCNKITCTNCRTISCYVCQKAIPEGYAHFDQRHPSALGPSTSNLCLLWDRDEATKDQAKVVAARDIAQQKLREAAAANGYQLNDEDLAVAAPEAARPAPPPAARHLPHGPGHPIFPGRPVPIGHHGLLHLPPLAHLPHHGGPRPIAGLPARLGVPPGHADANALAAIFRAQAAMPQGQAGAQPVAMQYFDHAGRPIPAEQALQRVGGGQAIYRIGPP